MNGLIDLPPDSTHCRCCAAAVERGDLPESHLAAPCPHPPCDYCQPEPVASLEIRRALLVERYGAIDA